MTPKEHRERNTIAIGFIVMVVILNIIDIEMTKHDMHDCEEMLFEKLTNQKLPKELK